MDYVKKKLEKGKDINMTNAKGVPLLHIALLGSVCKMDDIRRLLDLGANIASVDRCGRTPLHLAALMCSFDIIKLLLDRGAETNVRDKKTLKSPFHYALVNLNVDVIKLFLEHGADVLSVDSCLQTPLHMAILSRDFPTKIVKPLLDHHGSPINAVNIFDGSLLNSASRNFRCKEVVKLLLDWGADVNFKSAAGLTSLHYAAHTNCRIIKLLLDHGARMDIVDNKLSQSPFHYALKNRCCKVDVIELFLDRGCDISLVEGRGLTPLHLAVDYCSFDVIKLLIDRGAEIDVVDNEAGQSPFHYALIRYPQFKIDVIKFFLDQGGDVFSVDGDSLTPLHLAVLYCSFDVIKILLDHGARMDQPDNEWGQTPFHCALQDCNCKVDVIELFLDGGCDISLVDRMGRTPLHLAVIHCSFDVIKCLLDRGAPMDILDNEDQYALYYELEKPFCNVDVIKLFLDKGFDISWVNGYGRTPLHLAAFDCSFDVIKLLIDRGAQINQVDYGGFQSPFHIALNCNFRIDVIKLFLDLQVDLSLVDRWDKTPLYIAAFECSFHVIKLLIDHITRMDVVSNTHLTLLFLYSLRSPNCKVDVVKLFLDQKVDMNFRSAEGYTPLHYAAANVSTRMNALRLLLDTEADINAVDENNRSPLYYAVLNCRRDVIKVLLDHGALIIHKNCDFSFRNTYLDNEEFFESLKLLTKYAILENPVFQVDGLITMEEHSYHFLRITHFAQECGREFDKMYSESISDNVTLRDFLSRQPHTDATCKPKPENILNKLLRILIDSNYPIYREVLSAELKTQVLIEKMYEEPMYSVSSLPNHGVIQPYKIVLDFDSACCVVKYLPHDDLLNLILAFHTSD